MKKILTFFMTLVFGTSLLCPFFPLPVQARAATETDETYACIQQTAYFYERESDDSGLFILPKSYFVKVITAGVHYSYVQYLTDLPPYRAVYGYCKTAELTFVDFRPACPYLYLTVDVNYSMDSPSGIKVDSGLNTIRLTYVYYGEYTVGSSTFCYVQRDGEFGYIPKTMDITYPLNEEYLSQDKDKPDKRPSTTEGEQNKIVLFSVIAILAAALFYFLLKPKKESE